MNSPENMTILVVDDTPSIRTLVGYALKKLGFEMVEAGNGVQALALFTSMKNRHTPPRLVITDLHMPDMDGVALIREIRQLDKVTPILMLTTESLPEMMMQGKQAGANGWVVKPIKTDSLEKLVRRLTSV